MRNLVIGCDGTWNDTDGELTNVASLLNACSARNQVTHYEGGGGQGHLEALPGGIYGKGLDRQILGGYRFLRKRFADADHEPADNRVFIFGFSRGASVARRLASLLSYSGVPVKAWDVELAWQLYQNQDADSVAALKGEGPLKEIPIEMVGVWDTVKTTTDADFDDHKLPECVVAGYHAMAIDEQRKLFPVLKWNREGRVTQTWFFGVHSDVGRGYGQTALSDIALQWMVDRGYGHGLRFKVSAINQLKSDPLDRIHDSYDGIWKGLGKRSRANSPSARIHDSVRARLEGRDDYQPGNLPPDPNYES
ncbi:MAG: DUF2235 domain-containing protein [Gammaproteobacteria bacterium]